MEKVRRTKKRLHRNFSSNKMVAVASLQSSFNLSSILLLWWKLA
jgi:hypothetical protein